VFYSVLVASSIDTTYQYESPLDLEVGQVVVVSFNRNTVLGLVMSKDIEKKFYQLKPIDRSLNYFFTPVQRQFMSFFAHYNMQKLGNVLKLMLNSNIKSKTAKKKFKKDFAADAWDRWIVPVLSDEQKDVYNNINKDKFSVTLLEGVTGSGKTEIYINLIIDDIVAGNQCLVMIPEIALANQVIDRFKRYGIIPYVYTSFETPAERREVWKGVALGQINLVIGTRSALFLPFQKLKMIIIDEEQDASYKQEDGVVYNARDMSVVLAKMYDIPIILGSATPSLESIYNTIYGEYKHLRLSSRYNGAQLPSVKLVQKHHDELFTEEVLKEIETTLQNGEQVLIYFNRRGYNLISKCGKCSRVIDCPFCSSYLVKHTLKGVYECHYCFYQIKIDHSCPKCGEVNAVESFVDGIEKVAEVVSEKFPERSVGVASSDTFTSANKINSFLESVRKHEFDIIVGTQIIAKGHHFKDLTLVCVLDLDGMLKAPDIRARERAYQFFTQISGRAGREEKQGRVLVQSSMKDLDFDLFLNRDRFYEAELADRKRFNLPPFKRLTAVIVPSKSAKVGAMSATKIVQELLYVKNIQVFGPIPAPIFKISGQYRWRLLIRYNRDFIIQNVIERLRIKAFVKAKFDIDPMSFF